MFRDRTKVTSDRSGLIPVPVPPRLLHLMLETDRNSVLVMVLKLAIFFVSVTAVIVKHGFGVLSVTAKVQQGFGVI